MSEEKGDVITAGIKVFKTGTTKTTPFHYLASTLSLCSVISSSRKLVDRLID